MDASRWVDTQGPEIRCPLCDHPLDRFTSPDGATPEPGDTSVCISCASPLVICKGLTVRAMTGDEFAALDDETRDILRQYQAAVRSLDRREMNNG